MNCKIIRTIICIIGIIILIGSAIYGAYVGIWLMFIKPITETARAFDSGTLTSAMIVRTVCKCIFASLIGNLIFYLGYVLCRIIIYLSKYIK